MAVIVSSTTITLDGSSGEFAGKINVAEPVELYYITGAATAVANYNVSPVGTPDINCTFSFKYTGNLDITTNSATFTFFGIPITQLQLQKHMWIKCVWNGSSWLVDIKMDFSQSNIISANNLGTGAIDASVIKDNTINIHQKSVPLSLTNTEIAANTINGHQKLVAGSVTDTELSSGISGSKLTTHSVPNSAISTTVSSAIKITDSSGNMNDLALGANQLPIGNGTNVTTISLSSIQNTTGVGLQEAIILPVSFESGEQAFNRIYIPYNFHIHEVLYNVTKAIAGTDNATIDVYVQGNQTTFTSGTPITIAASSGIGTNGAGVNPLTNYTGISGNHIDFITSKTTPGGKALLTVFLERV
jgi:hypothetical protein